jgi:hypothetical protein
VPACLARGRRCPGAHRLRPSNDRFGSRARTVSALASTVSASAIVCAFSA